MNIIATIQDSEYSKKFRDGIFCIDSKWTWGLGDDGQLYCKDDSKKSLFPGEWFSLDQMQSRFDLKTIHKLSRWANSIVLRDKVKTLLDKDAANLT